MQLSSPLPLVRHSDAPPVNWGGRRKRWEDHPGACVRAYCPYSRTPLSFGSVVSMGLWHIARFDPSTLSITCKPTKVQATVEGQVVKAEATFVTVSRDRSKRFHIVCAPGTNRATVRALEAIAGCHRRTTVVQHDPASVVTDRALIERLQSLRQAAVIHLRDGPGTDPFVLAAVRDSHATRSTLHRALGNLSPQLIDARVSHLHCAGYLVMDPSTEDYTVQLARGAR